MPYFQVGGFCLYLQRSCGSLELDSPGRIDNIAQAWTMHNFFNVAIVSPSILMQANFAEYGTDKTCSDAKEKGVDGFIIVDMPPEEADDFHSKCIKHDVALGYSHDYNCRPSIDFV